MLDISSAIDYSHSPCANGSEKMVPYSFAPCRLQGFSIEKCGLNNLVTMHTSYHRRSVFNHHCITLLVFADEG